MPVGSTDRVRFRDLPRRAGWSFLISGFASRLPQAMMPLGVVLLLASATGRYGPGGFAVAAWSGGSAVGGPVIGALADRYGHRLVGLTAMVGNVAALVALVAVATGSASLAAVLAAAAVVGVADPQIGALARHRWGQLADRHAGGRDLVGTAFAYESAADEASFVLGPAVVGTLAGAMGPAVALLVAAGLGAAGQCGFALHRTAVPGQRTVRSRSARPPLPWRSIAPLLLTVASVGAVYGSTQTGIAAVLGAHQTPDLAGPVYAALGAGSAAAGLLTTVLPRCFGPQRRLVPFGLMLAVVAAPLGFLTSPGPHAMVCAVTGAAVGPLLISGYTLAEQHARPNRGATVMTVFGTAGTVGVALAASLAGAVADSWSPSVALLIPSTAGLAAVAAGVVYRILARRHPEPGRRAAADLDQ